MAHEDLTRARRIEGSSDRSFGLVFAGVFLLVAFWPLLHGRSPRWWASGVAVGFGLVALVRPVLLAVFNRLWSKLGVLLGRVVSPIALGILFYGVLTPTGAMIRLTGKDPLRLRRDRGAKTYWIAREPPGPAPDSMTHQF